MIAISRLFISTFSSVVFTLLVITSTPARAQVVLQNAVDATLTQFQNREANLGGLRALLLYNQVAPKGVYRPLIKFDLEQIESKSLSRAELQLYQLPGNNYAGNDMLIELYAVADSWVEGNGTDNFSASSGVSWINRSNGARWFEPGGNFDFSTDFGFGANGLIASHVIGVASEGSWHSFDLTAIVNQWLAGRPNHGIGIFLYSGDYSQYDLASSENSQFKPRLNLFGLNTETPSNTSPPVASPVEPAVPVEPSGPVITALPTLPALPTIPNTSPAPTVPPVATAPTVPVIPTAPTVPAEPPWSPVEPSEPSGPASEPPTTPTVPTVPTVPTTPSEPTDPSTDPDPTTPTAPSIPMPSDQTETASVGCIGVPAPDLQARNIVNVSTDSALQQAIRNAPSGSTIVIAPGIYELSSTLVVRTPDLTIRGGGKSCEDVVLRGRGMDNANYVSVPHGVWTDQPDLSVENLTISDVYYHTIALNYGAESPRLINLQLLDSGQQFIKSSSAPVWGDAVDNGLVDRVTIRYTNGTPRTDHGAGTGYTQGMSIHGADGWIIRRSYFEGILSRDTDDFLNNPTILIWRGSRNSVVEQNVFVDVDRAIAFGLEDDNNGNSHFGGRITNNMIYYSPGLMTAYRRDRSDAAILVWDSPGTLVGHNTCVTNGNLADCLTFRWDTSGAFARNNLVDARVRSRGGAYTESGTRTVISPSLFIGDRDLHIDLDAPGVGALIVDRLPSTPIDIDGQARSARTFAGADEPAQQ